MNPFFMVMAGGVAFWGSVLYLALRFVRASERRGIDRTELAALRGRVEHLEEELAGASTEIERLASAERFTAQLLTSRSAPSAQAI